MKHSFPTIQDVPNKMLIIDDEESVRDQLESIFSPVHDIITASNGEEGIEAYNTNKNNICAVLFDLNMQPMDGQQMLEALAKSGAPEIVPFFLITGALDQTDVGNKYLNIIKSLYDKGVMDVINKPFEPEIIIRRVQTVIELFNRRNYLDKVVKQQMEDLAEQNIVLAEQKAELKSQNIILEQQKFELREMYTDMVQALATATEFRSAESGEHVKRLQKITRLFLNTFLGDPYTEEEKNDIALAAILHDVGKISIKDAILEKPGKLTAEEFAIMQTHTTRGEELIAQIHSDRNKVFFNHARQIARYHHERWDGKGYPDGLKGNEIPISAQIVSIADVYDALVSTRVYKPPFSHEQTIDMIRTGKCGTFNPDLISALDILAEDIKQLYMDRETRKVS